MAACIQCPLAAYPLKLKQGQDIKAELLKFAEDNRLSAPFVMTCVGSVTRAKLRLANGETKQYAGHYEIVSLVGTLAGQRGHLHICLSDRDGRCIGGHVVSDLIVYTTAEIVIGECSGALFKRERDAQTGYEELNVSRK